MIVRPRLPRVMLSLSTSGATYFSVCALRRLPNLERNSGCSCTLASDIGLERRLLRKSCVGLGAGSGFAETGGFEVSAGVTSGSSIVIESFADPMLSRRDPGFGLVDGGDLTGSVSSRISGDFASSTIGSIVCFSGSLVGDFLNSSGLGGTSASLSPSDLLGIASCLKLDVASFVVGVASFSEICSDS